MLKRAQICDCNTLKEILFKESKKQDKREKEEGLLVDATKSGGVGSQRAAEKLFRAKINLLKTSSDAFPANRRCRRPAPLGKAGKPGRAPSDGAGARFLASRVPAAAAKNTRDSSRSMLTFTANIIV